MLYAIINTFDSNNINECYVHLQHDISPGQYPEDIPDARQITAACMISDVIKDQIVSMWSVIVGNKLTVKHFIILLSNGSHYCSCLSLNNRGIICRHYFQVMLHTPDAKFHIRLIPSRWYYKDKDPSKEPFLVASKFEVEAAPMVLQHDIPFLTAIQQTVSQDSITQHERVTDIQLYGKISGLARKVTMKAVKERDLSIINLLEDYLKDNEREDESDVDDDELNKENDPLNISNPNKRTRSKGRPKGTRRIKASYERKASTSSGNKQYRCGHCGGIGHNKRNCKNNVSDM